MMNQNNVGRERERLFLCCICRIFDFNLGKVLTVNVDRAGYESGEGKYETYRLR